MPGTATGRHRTHAPVRADALADIKLPDHEGHEVRLGDLWRDRAAVLVWLRHYGWIFCKDHAVQLDRAREQFEAAGARLVLIGQASDRQADHFRRRHGIHVPVLADEQRESYGAAGAKVASASELVGPKVVARGALATLRTRKLQTRPIGDPAQLGGTIVVRPGGDVVWSHMSEDASDNASPEEILAALRG